MNGPKQKTVIMSKQQIEPPSFISETKSYETYKRDLERWCLLTSLDKKVQAVMVVHCLDGDPSGIKDKIDAGITDAELQSEDGVQVLLEFLEKIYKKDTLADSFDKYISFEKLRRKPGISIQQFIPEWTTAYQKAVNVECTLSDKVLAFKLLDASNLSNIERNLVLTGVDYSEENLLDQMQSALKKFISRSTLSGGEVEQKMDSTYVTADNLEQVLMAKGWTKNKKKLKPDRGQKREASPSAPDGARPISKNYKGRKNPLGKDFKVLKCFKCACEHDEACECPCVFHMADKCPRKKEGAQGELGGGGRADIAHIMKTNNVTYFMKEDPDKSDSEIVLFIEELQEETNQGNKIVKEALVTCPMEDQLLVSIPSLEELLIPDPAPEGRLVSSYSENQLLVSSYISTTSPEQLLMSAPSLEELLIPAPAPERRLVSGPSGNQLLVSSCISAPSPK